MNNLPKAKDCYAVACWPGTEPTTSGLAYKFDVITNTIPH